MFLNFKKIIKYSIFILGFSLALFFLQDYYESSSAVYTPGKDGVIYFSGRTNQPGHLSSIFALDIVSKKIFVIKETQSNAITNTGNISPNQNKNVYSVSFLSKGKNGQFYIPNTSQLAVFDATDSTTRIITRSSTYKTTPEWSPSGELIAFVSRTLTNDLSDVGIESRDVKIVDLSGVETFIANGFQPHWFPDEKHLLILKNNGLYVFNMDTKNEQKLLGIENIPMSSDMKMDLSRDGSHIALSLSKSGKVFIINIISLETFKAEIEREISGPAFWPVFSEDGDELALYEVDIDLLNTNPQPRISVYNLKTSKIKTIYDLSAFDPESIAITDWRK